MPAPNPYSLDDVWAPTLPMSQAGSQTGGSGAGLPGFNGQQVQPANAIDWNTGFDVGSGSPEFEAQYGRKFMPKPEEGGIGLPGAPVAPAGAGGTGTSGTGGTGGAGGTGSTDYVSTYQSMLKGISAASDPAQRAVLSDKLARDLQANLTQAGHDVKWAGDQELIVDGRRYTIGSWNPSGQSSYTPGEIPTNDLPSFSFDSLMRDTESPQMDSFMSNLLANPESLSPQAIEMLKAKSKDEIAEMDVQNQEQLGTLGRSYGIQESPWLAGQQLDAGRARDTALVGSNRAIDISAATTNMEDRRQAAALGQSWNAAKQSRVFQAASADVARAAATGDRLALRESVNQKAAELKISAEQVLANHIQFKLSEATKKYGIDVDAALKKYGVDVGFEMNADNLAQADRHHLEELAMTLQQLQQQDAQFTASYDLERKQAGESERHNRALEDLTRTAQGG